MFLTVYKINAITRREKASRILNLSITWRRGRGKRKWWWINSRKGINFISQPMKGFKGGANKAVALGPPETTNKSHRFNQDICFSKLN
jgi:hypothetical protein